MDVASLGPRKRLLFNTSFVGMLVGLPALTWYFSIAIVHYDAAGDKVRATITGFFITPAGNRAPRAPGGGVTASGTKAPT